jgi:tRNA(Arg) A34 adenosine deaminase TadA
MQLAIAEAKRARDRGDYPIGAVVYGVSQEDIAAYGRKRGTEDYKWRACLIPCRLVFEKGNNRIPVTGGFLRQECKKLFGYGDA